MEHFLGILNWVAVTAYGISHTDLTHLTEILLN